MILRAKHHESVVTRFYQEYVLREKFGIDKRKVFLSAAIRMGVKSRDEALRLLQVELLSDDEKIKDKQYVLKKLGFDDEEFDILMKEAPMSHASYKTDRWYIDHLLTLAKRLGVQTFYGRG